MRDQIERGAKELVGVTGVFNYSAKEHMGLDERPAVMIRIDPRGPCRWTQVR